LGWLPSPKAERLWHAVALWTQSLPKALAEEEEEGEEEEEEFITSGNWRGKHNSLSRGAGADQP